MSGEPAVALAQGTAQLKRSPTGHSVITVDTVNRVAHITTFMRWLPQNGAAIALVVLDPELRQRYMAAVVERITWQEPHFHLFAVQIENPLVRYSHGQQAAKLWLHGGEFTRQYG